jgi:hypothetical protein
MPPCLMYYAPMDSLMTQFMGNGEPFFHSRTVSMIVGRMARLCSCKMHFRSGDIDESMNIRGVELRVALRRIDGLHKLNYRPSRSPRARGAWSVEDAREPLLMIPKPRR